jgi:hypothetical protein
MKRWRVHKGKVWWRVTTFEAVRVVTAAGVLDLAIHIIRLQ